ncbi:FAD dependent oxidoreductase [Mucilaginibacter mallensis]|uniref:FAD dependent oxidoreductase n=1 Tax=Mucilaginibacter mallensis TaxID=652787 RepID=A0A1H1MDC5_MUCMA|nr:FAD-dependent oxidoreductase [Mucilaginibacter mallensis]SDR84592.1 FAD dependent oxidoreductase [Mucilaginibacter mallensis]
MIKKIAVLLLVFNCSISYAQSIKTDVLVIGGGLSGVAAAIQSARSKVKTVLIERDSILCNNLSGKAMEYVLADRNSPSGIWDEFRKHVVDRYHKTPGYDTIYNDPLKLEPSIGAAILANIADTVKNLSIELNTSFTNIVKDGDRWQVTVTQNGKIKTIKARILIDATEKGSVIAKAGATYVSNDEWKINDGTNAYRTSIAMGSFRPYRPLDTSQYKFTYIPSPEYCIPIRDFLAKGVDNLLVAGKQWRQPTNPFTYLRANLNLGQAAGVIAAYCAFYKTTTANLNVRLIQGELLDFKSCLLPFDDIGVDPYWRAIQQICATGMLKGVTEEREHHYVYTVLFMPDSIVTTAEIKPVLLETYTRAFLWFNANKLDKQFTVGNLLSFISELTLTEPDNVRKSMSRDWNSLYHFTSKFDMNRPITRREFAILANKFLNPFARTVDLNGRLVN